MKALGKVYRLSEEREVFVTEAKSIGAFYMDWREGKVLRLRLGGSLGREMFYGSPPLRMTKWGEEVDVD